MKEYPTILLVDDEPDVLETLEIFLEVLDAKIITFSSSEDAFNFIKTTDIEIAIAILDINMPNKTGYDLAKEMHRNSFTRFSPILFLSGGDQDKQEDEGYDYGAIDYLTKPIQQQALQMKAKVFLELHNHKQDIQDAKEEAILASKAKTEFLTNITHELTNPLNSVIGFSELILEDIKLATTSNIKQTATEIENNASLILSSGKNLKKIISNIIFLTELELNNVSNKKVSTKINIINDFIKESTDDYKQYSSANIDTCLESDPGEVKTDIEILKIIIDNILNNAFKFTIDGNISISSKFCKNSNSLQVSIKDTGIGINNDKLNSIFDLFVQEDSGVTKKFPGIGLGLTIVKKLLPMANTVINIQSSQGKGTEVILNIEQKD